MAAQRYVQYFRASGNRFGCMQAIDIALGVPHVKAARIVLAGKRKEFSEVEQCRLSQNKVLPGGTDIGAALEYSNHRSAAPHSDSILAKIFDDATGSNFSPQRSAWHH